jgi:hypothetical protein
VKGLRSVVLSLVLLVAVAGCGSALAPPIGGHGYPQAISWVDHRLAPRDYILLIGLSRALPNHKPMTVYIMRHNVHLMGLLLQRNTLVGIAVNPNHPDWMGPVYFQRPRAHFWTLLVPAKSAPTSRS